MGNFDADKSSPVHVNNLGKDPTQVLDATTLTVAAEYWIFIEILPKRQRNYNGSNSYLYINAVKSKQNDSVLNAVQCVWEIFQKVFQFII